MVIDEILTVIIYMLIYVDVALVAIIIILSIALIKVINPIIKQKEKTHL